MLKSRLCCTAIRYQLELKLNPKAQTETIFARKCFKEKKKNTGKKSNEKTKPTRSRQGNQKFIKSDEGQKRQVRPNKIQTAGTLGQV